MTIISYEIEYQQLKQNLNNYEILHAWFSLSESPKCHLETPGLYLASGIKTLFYTKKIYRRRQDGSIEGTLGSRVKTPDPPDRLRRSVE